MSLFATTSTAATWSASAVSAANAAVTATHPGEVGKTHYITLVIASYDSAPAAGKLLQIFDGTTEIASLFMSDPPLLVLSSPRRFTLGNKAEATLAAGGLAVIGRLTLMGFSI